MQSTADVLVDSILQSVAMNRAFFAVPSSEDRALPYVTLRSSSQPVASIWILLHAADADSKMAIAERIDALSQLRNERTRCDGNSTRKKCHGAGASAYKFC
jgi:hypothetical protein